MKKKLIFFLLVIAYIPITAQINKNGIPFIKNYTTTDFDAAEQNWAVCEDSRGVIYVGNNDDGILVFDGTNWNKIPISNGSIIRSLIYANDGTVYVGGVEEFGYLAPDVKGKMQYHSLINQLDTVSFKNVWKVFATNEAVYFCANLEIFKFIDKKLVKVFKVNGDDPRTFLSFLVDGIIYWGSYDYGLYQLTEDSVIYSLGGDFYKEKDVFTMIPWSKSEILVTTMEQGIFIYNTETGLSKTFSSLGKKYEELDKLMQNSQVYNGVKLRNGNFALATLSNGCLIFNSEGELIFKLDKENGLLDNTAINLFEASDANLWLGMNNGVSCVELKTPFTKFDQKYNFDGLILDVQRFNGVLYISTTSGVFYLDKTKEIPSFKKVDGLNKQVWNLSVFSFENSESDKLILASQFGVFEVIANKAILVSNESVRYDAKVIFQSKQDPNILYIGHSSGIAQLIYKDGKWIDKSRIIDISVEIETIEEDNQQNLWLGTALNGVIKVNPDGTYIKYGIESGLPDLRSNKIYNIDGDIVCATIKGLYRFNEPIGKFEKYKGFGEQYYSNTDEVKEIFTNKMNEYWIIASHNTNNEYIEKISISQDRIITVDNIPFKRLVKNSFHEISFDGDNGVWIATSDALYNYKEKLSDEFSLNYYNLISKVGIGIDSIVFFGTYFKDTSHLIVDINQPEILKKTIDYKNKSFQFYYSSPYFPSEEIKYSYKLEGYEDEWSSWIPRADKDYTNLNEGHYTFMVKAKNIYGIESEIAKYEFAIKPPWYRTIIAYIVYGILAIFIIGVIVKIYTRRLELEKIHLEQLVKERTEEVVKQKDEIEKQRDTIADKNRSITDSIEYASRIQKAVLPSKEFVEEVLPDYFILFRPRDIVSGDFYWITKKDNLLVVIAADCTGHGVPGAFMSMLGVSFLNEIVNRHEIISADKILNSLRTDIKKTLGQEGKEGEAKDGMDIALCIIDLENMKMQYAGAYNPLYLFRNNELIEIKADRMPIGIYIKEKESFTNNDIDLQKNDTFYLFSDGYPDQFGGEDGRKFKTKKFKELLLSIHKKPMKEQREILNTTIDQWRGRWDQVDDIIILGIRV